MPYYVQLSEDGVVCAVVETSGPLTIGPRCMEISSMRPELAGMRWNAQSGAFEPVEPPPPQQITRAQGKAVLIMRGLWPSVLAYVDSITDATEKALANIALHDTLTWERTSPTVISAAQALGMDDADIDALFTAAANVIL